MYKPKNQDVITLIAYLKANPTATRAEIAKALGWSIAKVANTKTWVNQHKEYGVQITRSTPGYPNFRDEPRHRVIDTVPDTHSALGYVSGWDEVMIKVRGLQQEGNQRVITGSRLDAKIMALQYLITPVQLLIFDIYEELHK